MTNQEKALEATWDQNWIGPFEGPFTLAWKYAWANMASGQAIANLFCRRSLTQHGCGSEENKLLVPPRPSKSLETRETAWAGHFLSAYAGEDIAKLLANSTVFRYCQSCLAHGYQSTFFQLSALSLCPVHREPILEKCLTCGAPTPGYTLSWNSFRTPFYCGSCGTPFGGAISIKAWSETRDIHAASEIAFQPIASWLQSLKGKFPYLRGFVSPKWPEDDIHLKVLNVSQQVAEFWLLAQVEPISVSCDFFIALDPRVRFISTAHYHPLLNFSTNNLDIHLRFAPIYKSIRRQIVKRFFSQKKQWIHNLSSRPILYAFGRPVQVNEPGSVQAFAIWRAYYESSIDESQYFRESRGIDDSTGFFEHSKFKNVRGMAQSHKYFSIDFSLLLGKWNVNDLSALAQLVLAHFYSVCSAIGAFLEHEAMLERPPTALMTPTEVISKAQHRFNSEVAALNVYWIQGVREARDVWGAVGFSLVPEHKFARLHQRRLLRFNSRCAEVLLERDVSCTKPHAFP